MEFQKFDSNCRTEYHQRTCGIGLSMRERQWLAKTRALRHTSDERYRKGMTGVSGEHLCTASEV